MNNKDDMIYVLTNTNFMNWVIKNLYNHYYIDDHSKYNDNDLFYAKKIHVLYDLISEYAMKNNIESTQFGYYDLYFIEYNGSVFFVYRGTNSYGCFNNTLDKNKLPYCINFRDIVKNKITDIINFDNGLLNDLKENIIRLYKKGFSLDLIGDIVDKFIVDIDDKGKSFTYQKELK